MIGVNRVFGCVWHKFGRLKKPSWADVEKHMEERGFCEHPCASSGYLKWLYLYDEGALTYCPYCGHYGILVRTPY